MSIPTAEPNVKSRPQDLGVGRCPARGNSTVPAGYTALPGGIAPENELSARASGLAEAGQAQSHMTSTDSASICTNGSRPAWVALTRVSGDSAQESSRRRRGLARPQGSCHRDPRCRGRRGHRGDAHARIEDGHGEHDAGAADPGIGSGHSAVVHRGQARRVLGLPDGYRATYLIGLGYPAGRPLRTLDRPKGTAGRAVSARTPCESECCGGERADGLEEHPGHPPCPPGRHAS